jgi:hypothetical protein
MKITSLVPILLLMLASILSFGKELSEDSKISLITCGSGEEIYSTFGHSAIRVTDPQTGIDLVFNYGAFNFSDPQFYTKFIRGKLKYYLSLSDYENFIYSYQEENRAVFEQVLSINTAQKNSIYEFLINNYKPEKRYYLYDFFYDNCSTRELDLLIKVLDKDLILPSDIERKTDKTFRDLIKPYLASLPWAAFGIDLGLGSKTDKITTKYEHSFLPDYLKSLVDEIKIKDGTSIKPLVEKENILYNPEEKHQSASFNLSPMVFFWTLFVIVAIITFLGYKNKKYDRKIDFLIFALTGLLGVFLVFLWFGTDHQATANNYNLIWALPSHLLFSMVLILKPTKFIIKPYAIITLISLSIVLLIWPFLLQRLHPSIIPIILVLIARSIVIYTNMARVCGDTIAKRRFLPIW